MTDSAQTLSLYERLGGIYGISGAVDVLADRLYDNVSANQNAHVQAFHQMKGHAGFKFLVTAWSIEQTGGPKCYPGRDMQESHAHLFVTDFEFTIVAGEIAATPSSAIGRWLSEALPEDVPPDSGPSLATGSR